LVPPFDQFSQENDLVVPFLDGDIVVLDPVKLVLQFGQFMVVGGKKGAGARPFRS
jgi:hypothetical protein